MNHKNRVVNQELEPRIVHTQPIKNGAVQFSSFRKGGAGLIGGRPALPLPPEPDGEQAEADRREEEDKDDEPRDNRRDVDVAQRHWLEGDGAGRGQEWCGPYSKTSFLTNHCETDPSPTFWN